MATYASLEDLGRRTRENVESAMFGGEQFLGALDTWHFFRMIYTEMLILTDRRIILYKKGLIRESTRDFDRDRITNVRFDKGLFRRKLSISGSNFSRKWRVPYRGGQEFAAAIRAPKPQPIYSETSSRASRASSETNNESTVAKRSKDGGDDSIGIESAVITNPNVEQFGFDGWHYLSAATLVLSWLTLSANFGSLAFLLFVTTGVAMYIDILVMREASTWTPRAWLYSLGWLVGGIGVAVYLFNRYRLMSNSDSSTFDGKAE